MSLGTTEPQHVGLLLPVVDPNTKLRAGQIGNSHTLYILTVNRTLRQLYEYFV
jgi:hypothetical protein